MGVHGVGLDIGGSAVKAGRLSADGERGPARFAELDFEAGSEAVLDGLAALAPLCLWFGMGAAVCERRLAASSGRVSRAVFHGWLACFVAATFLPYL